MMTAMRRCPVPFPGKSRGGQVVNFLAGICNVLAAFLFDPLSRCRILAAPIAGTHCKLCLLSIEWLPAAITHKVEGNFHEYRQRQRCEYSL
jgi:hypothetical protein